MIFIGLQLAENVLITFVLFYGWLLAGPFICKGFPEDLFYLPKKAAIYGIGSGLVFFGFIFGGLSFLHGYFLDVNQLRALLVDWGFIGSREFFLIFVLLVANPILEEVYWRGFMHDRLSEAQGTAKAIAITAVFYALYHLLSVIPIFEAGFSLIAVLPVLLAGLFWGYVRQKTGSLAAVIISHALSDLGIMCVYWFVVR